jgi:putative acetyltransferase
VLSTAHGTSLQALTPKIELFSPASPAELEPVRAIFREYAQGLGVDLCFQDFETELATLPGEYAEPRGALLLATVDGQLAGCCALHPMDTVDAARQAGYSTVLLDTLDDMEAARGLYEDLGFVEIPPYYHNPIAGAHYLKVDVERTTGW